MRKTTTAAMTSNWSGAIEAAVKDGRMNLSEYVKRYIDSDVEALNARLLLEQAELQEKCIADLDRENKMLRQSINDLLAETRIEKDVVRKFADHGEA